MEINKLIKIAKEFRLAIESIPIDERPLGLKNFPTGACGDATLLLGAYLSDCGMLGFEYICGERGLQSENTWTSHAWLQKGDCIIDITADQFSDVPLSVIVSENSAWHKEFSAENLGSSDFRLWSGFGAEILHPTYGQILNALSTLKEKEG